MAIGSLKKSFEQLFSSPDAYEKAQKASGSQITSVLGLNIQEQANNQIRATQLAIKAKIGDVAGNKLINSNASAWSITKWKNYVTDICNEWNTTTVVNGLVVKAGPVSGCFKVNPQESDVEFIVTGGNQKTGTFSLVNFRALGQYLSSETYKRWKADNSTLAKNVRETRTTGAPDQADGKGSRITHTESSVYEGWLALKAESIQAKFQVNKTDIDIPRVLLNALRSGLEEDTIFKRHAYSQKRVVKLQLMEKDIDLRYDKSEGMKADFLQVMEELLDSWDYYSLKPEVQRKVKASKPITEQIANAAERDIIDSLVKGKTKGVKTRLKGKKPVVKNKKRKATLKKRKASKKPRKQKLSVPQKLAVAKAQVRKREKGEKGTTAASNAELIKIKKYINSRLGAEVRRNMGRPALINRTGRFSNSVQLLSLTEGQNSVMAKYTYLLNPYATFENAGQKRWPLAYNPKPLIAKSIRNLAQGRIEQKLTVRRM